MYNSNYYYFININKYNLKMFKIYSNFITATLNIEEK